jgi:hypothetical protein
MSRKLVKGDIVVYAKNGHEQQAQVMLIAGDDVMIELVADRRAVHTVMSNIYRTSRAAMDVDEPMEEAAVSNEAQRTNAYAFFHSFFGTQDAAAAASVQFDDKTGSRITNKNTKPH